MAVVAMQGCAVLAPPEDLVEADCEGTPGAFPFSGETGETLQAIFKFLLEIHNETGMEAEVLDCILRHYKDTGSLSGAIHFACCEWDL